ncbi:hypothetical protein [Sphingobacterium puteale]|uniref:hypothetical protein n=1 Tax=Sphingobacterium puteale TaxID=2420510 RepID=UPI003D956742
MKTLKISNTEYIVDIDNNRLVESPSRNCILRFQDMKEVPEGYAFNFDADGKLAGGKGTHRHIIPFMVQLDPEGMAKKYGIEPQSLPAKDRDLKFNKKILEERVGGKLPVFKIHDQDFIVDLRLGLLRPVNDFSTMGIVLRELDIDPSGTVYQFLYHTKKHEVVLWDENIQAIPKNVLPVEIPIDHVLDPFGFAMRHSEMGGLSSRYPMGRKEDIEKIDWNATGLMGFFNEYPQRNNLEAAVLRWDQTCIPEIISGNQAKNKQVESPKAKNKRRGL